ncbi:MAG: DUF4431 domain-containing protein [bacterium]
MVVSKVTVTGTMFHSITARHKTTVLINVLNYVERKYAEQQKTFDREKAFKLHDVGSDNIDYKKYRFSNKPLLKLN